MKYIILGAGPCGLAFANRLLEFGEDSFLILEKENIAGGLCRSEYVDGAPFDICGIHLLEEGNKKATDFIFQFIKPEECYSSHWLGKIFFDGVFMDSPFESNIYQLSIDYQIDCLKSIITSQVNKKQDIPERFADWIDWKFGDRIGNDYMLPYNTKMFYGFLEELGTYWLYKLPDVSFDEILRSCIEKKAYGKLPGYGKVKFYYPKENGYGEIWNRMAQNLGDKLIKGYDVKAVDFANHMVNGEFSAERIIWTIPWTDPQRLENIPEDLLQSIHKLRHTSVRLEYSSAELQTDAAWVYYPDINVPYHRVMCRHNIIPGAKGIGLEINQSFAPQSENEWSYLNQYTYPVNTVEKPYIMKRLLEWGEMNNVYGVGRWGEWCHHNSDVVVEHALNLADRLLAE